MTMSDNGRDPERGSPLFGAALIVAVGVALGIAFNAMALAGRPPKGLAWVKSTPRIESLESLSQPSSVAPHASSPSTATEPGAGAAEAPTPPAVAAGTGAATPPASKPTMSAANEKTPGGKTGGLPAKPSADSKPGTSQKPATSTTTVAPGAAAKEPAGTPASSATATASNPAPSPPPAPADVPVIPDVPEPLKLEIATLKKLYDAGAALVIDAREAAEYSDGHIRGAVNLPYNDAMAEPERVKKLDPAGRPIVVYCSGGDCELSRDLAKVLIEAGKRRVLIFEGGFPEWQGAGYPVTQGMNP